MTNYRGLVWSLVAIAGTATAAAVAYRYVTRSVRSHEDEEIEGPNASEAASTTAAAAAVAPGHQPTANASEGNEDDAAALSNGGDDVEDVDDDGAAEMHQQQLVLMTREGNMLLSVFGLIMLLLVAMVGAILSWTSEEPTSPTSLPMFTPLMWIAFGIFTASSVEVLSQSSVATAEVPIGTDKTVFPHDQSDFELIQRHEDASKPSAKPTAGGDDDDSQPVSPRRSTTTEGGETAPANATGDDDDEEKAAVAPGDVNEAIRRAEALFEENKHEETRAYLKGVLATNPRSIELLWRLARACNYLVDELETPEVKKTMATEGLGYAERAYEIDANAAASNKWMGIMTGTMGNFRDLKDKIAGAYVIRDHIQRAIELDPTDATCHNILGQWCLAFADMTWIEKRAAAALFGTPPTATYDEAIGHFANAERISPGFWKKNVFLLAQTYHKMKDAPKAREWLAKADEVPIKTREDEDVHKDIVELRKTLRM